MQTAQRLLSPGDVAELLGCQAWRVSRLVDRGILTARRAGRVRVFEESDLPKIREALLAAGYLKPGPATTTAGP